MFCKKMQLKMEILDIQDADEAAPTPPPPSASPLHDFDRHRSVICYSFL